MYRYFGKRLIDIVLSLCGLIVLLPVFLILSVWVKLDSKGPVFFRQRRIGIHKKEFDILKFRTMYTDTPQNLPTHLLADPERYITRAGRFLRKTSLDELPQLINILKGDMSIVGPRPERPEIATQYKKYLPEFDLRLQCKCGLTGFAQVYGQYNTTPYDKLLMDLMYIANPSIAEDLKICFATVKILFMPESTEGIAEGQTTAARFSTKKESSDDEELNNA